MNWDPTPEVQFQTPPEVCRYMASLIPPTTRNILEPTAGDGNMLAVLDPYNVIAPDNFFNLDRAHFRFDCVVMNPPFSNKTANMEGAPDIDLSGMRFGYYILQQCMLMSDSIIALMPWFTVLDSDVRARQFKQWGLKSVTSLPRKTFNYARIQTCVLELKKGYKGATQFHIFNY